MLSKLKTDVFKKLLTCVIMTSKEKYFHLISPVLK